MLLLDALFDTSDDLGVSALEEYFNRYSFGGLVARSLQNDPTDVLFSPLYNPKAEITIDGHKVPTPPDFRAAIDREVNHDYEHYYDPPPAWADLRAGGIWTITIFVAQVVLVYIMQQLELHSPIGSGGDKHPGLYARSHLLLADGRPADAFNPPQAFLYVFTNTQPYARKIEKGESSQTPDGVYQAVALMAQYVFSDFVRRGFLKIEFSYDGPNRFPAIFVTQS